MAGAVAHLLWAGTPRGPEDSFPRASQIVDPRAGASLPRPGVPWLFGAGGLRACAAIRAAVHLHLTVRRDSSFPGLHPSTPFFRALQVRSAGPDCVLAVVCTANFCRPRMAI